jgi:type III pantothenate kinase
MNLLIDIGNTQVKLALVHSGEIQRLQTLDVLKAEPIYEILKTKPGIAKCIVVRSGAYPRGWQKELNSIFPGLIELEHSTPLPLKIIYDTKESLGMDRIASAIGAYHLFPGKNILVIDAGTAITVDFVSKEKKYLGGNIIPGMSMRFKALHEYTNRLPLVQPNDDFQLLGNSTETAIRAGVLNGIVFELEGYINALENKYPQLTVVMTGGDAEFFAKHLKSNIFVELNLIFAGLNRILEYNAHQGQNYSH